MEVKKKKALRHSCFSFKIVFSSGIREISTLDLLPGVCTFKNACSSIYLVCIYIISESLTCSNEMSLALHLIHVELYTLQITPTKESMETGVLQGLKDCFRTSFYQVFPPLLQGAFHTIYCLPRRSGKNSTLGHLQQVQAKLVHSLPGVIPYV